MIKSKIIELLSEEPPEVPSTYSGIAKLDPTSSSHFLFSYGINCNDWTPIPFDSVHITRTGRVFCGGDYRWLVRLRVLKNWPNHEGLNAAIVGG